MERLGIIWKDLRKCFGERGRNVAAVERLLKKHGVRDAGHIIAQSAKVVKWL
jgi:hypothetical protein